MDPRTTEADALHRTQPSKSVQKQKFRQMPQTSPAELDYKPPRILRRYTASKDIQPEETAPFGITEFDFGAKVSGAVVGKVRYQTRHDELTWMQRFRTRCLRLKVTCSLDDVKPIREELDSNPDLIGIPLRELDPFYIGRDTFITVSSERELYRFSSHRSLGLFSPDSELRQAAISIVTSMQFQAFIVCVIILDFLALVFGYQDEVISIGSDFFFAVYSAELIIKMIAYGLVIDQHSFLRNAHSCIEIVVVASNIVPLFLPISTMFKQLRVIRVIRLFRLIGTLQFTRKIMKAIVNSVKDLVPVFGLFFALIGFFSLCSLVFYKRVLLAKCVHINYTAIFEGAGDTRNYSSIASGSFAMHSRFLNWTDDSKNWQPGPYGAQRCPVITRVTNLLSGLIDDRHLRKCPKPYQCIQTTSGNPDFGFSNYDTLMLSMLSTFRLLCQDWWDNLFIQLVLVNGGHVTTVYFLALIFLGSHYVINLVLSTITLSYQRNERSEEYSEKELSKMIATMQINRNNFVRRQVEIYNVLVDQGRNGLNEPDYLRRLVDSLANSPMINAIADELVLAYNEKPEAGRESRLDGQQECCLGAQDKPGIPGRFGALLRSIVARKHAWDGLPIDWLINFVILMNATEMLVVTPVHVQSLRILEGTNLIYTMIFTVEAIIKIRYQRIRYLRNVMNGFDLLIVLICLVEMMLPSSHSRLAMILRMTRFLRLFKLARVSKELEKLITVMLRSFKSEMPLIFVSFVIVLISAGIGMVMFQETYMKHPQYLRPTQNFADLYNSILLVFRIMCGEWIENLWVCMKIMETATDKGFCVVYFLTNQIIVSLIIFQLYIGILLSKFSENRLEQDKIAKQAKDALDGTNGQGVVRVTEDERAKLSGQQLLLRIKNSLLKKLGLKSGKGSQSSKESVNDTAFTRFQARLGSIASNNSSSYPNYILVMTILSSTALVLDDYHLKSDPGLQRICDHLEIIFLCVFGAEVIIKMTAYGPKEYMSSQWRILDLVIVVVSLLDIIISNLYHSDEVNLAVLRVFRTLRCLRILRTANVWDGFKLTIGALFRSVGRLLFAFFVVIIVWLMFALVSTSLFSNKFYRCMNNSEVIDRLIVPNKTVCLSANHSWVNKRINFDNTLNAMLALLEISVFKGWIDIFQDISNAPDNVNEQPKIDQNSSVTVLIYILFIIIGSFFMIGMLIGVIVDSFESERSKMAMLTDSQKRLQSTLKQYLMFPLNPSKPVPDGWLSKSLSRINNTIYVEVFYLVLILTSTVLMALQYHPGKSSLVNVYLTAIDDLILFFFTMEIIMKIIGEGPYYLVPLLSWNLLDFTIVMLSVVGEVCDEAFDLQYLRVVRFARIFRMGRLLAKSTNIKTVRDILLAMVTTMPSMFNMIALLIMTICIFSIIGVSLFNDQDGNDAHPFNELFNFRSFAATWRMLFIVSTSAGFNDYLDGTMQFSAPYSTVGILFWVCYLCLSFFVLTNLIVSAVISSYNEVFNDEVSEYQLQAAETLTKMWNDFDQQGTGRMHTRYISELLDLLPVPLRIPQPNSIIISSKQIPVSEDLYVSHRDMVKVIVKGLLEEMGFLNPDEVQANMKDAIDNKSRLNTNILYSLRMASNTLKAAWRQKMLRQGIAKLESGGQVNKSRRN